MINTAIIGASGYSGFELLKMLSLREDVKINHIFANTNAGKHISEIYPSIEKEIDLKYESYDINQIDDIDIIFISLPSGETMKIIPGLINRGIKIIDLGGDFRLKNHDQYLYYYKMDHIAPEIAASFVYGLSEINKYKIKKSEYIANPGCYSTSILLALLPILKNKIISSLGIVINSLSGVSGAGRQEKFEYSFAELNENIRAYRIFEHQHIPEITQIIEEETNETVTFSFIPHLVPINRGIYTTIVCDLAVAINETEIYNIYNKYYADSFFIRLRNKIPELKNVIGTNYCDIFFQIDKLNNKLVLISIIDNLIKGAAGQAIQNMNIMFDLPENKGFKIKRLQYV